MAKKDTDELNVLLSEINKTQKEVSDLEEKRNSVDNIVESVRPIIRMRQELIQGGFENDQAFAIILTMLQNAFKTMPEVDYE